MSSIPRGPRRTLLVGSSVLTLPAHRGFDGFGEGLFAAIFVGAIGTEYFVGAVPRFDGVRLIGIGGGIVAHQRGGVIVLAPPIKGIGELPLNLGRERGTAVIVFILSATG